jgi:hypothetical protein
MPRNTQRGILLINSNSDQRGFFLRQSQKRSFAPGPGDWDSASRAVRSEIPGGEARAMTDFLNLGMLICASVGSMAFGVLAAYGILRAGFALMRPEARHEATKTRVEVARAVTE